MPHNDVPGGYGVHVFGHHFMSAATRAKISRALTGKPHPHKGHHPSQETREKIAASHLGKPHPHKGAKGPHKHGWHRHKHIA